jgi:uncharacterized protein YidB (DUF937 family)
MSLFGDLAGKLGGLLGQEGGTNSSDVVSAVLQGSVPDGVTGVLETLAANGLTDKVSSWASGSSLPITPEEIHSALGGEQVQQMADASGLPVGDFLKHLADHLPAAATSATSAN